jgi:hypothetical protein
VSRCWSRRPGGSAWPAGLADPPESGGVRDPERDRLEGPLSGPGPARCGR